MQILMPAIKSTDFVIDNWNIIDISINGINIPHISAEFTYNTSEGVLPCAIKFSTDQPELLLTQIDCIEQCIIDDVEVNIDFQEIFSVDGQLANGIPYVLESFEGYL